MSKKPWPTFEMNMQPIVYKLIENGIFNAYIHVTTFKNIVHLLFGMHKCWCEAS